MAAIAEADKMNFRTQIVDGKPQIFYDLIDDSSAKPRSKRNSRTINQTNRQLGQTSKANNAAQYEPKRQTTKHEQQSTNKKRVNDDGSSLGVYMTMDEIADLVNAVKENSKSDTNTIPETKALSPPRHRNEAPAAPVVPNLDLVLEPPPLPASQMSPRDDALGKMADKKRQKWMREKAEIERMQLEIEYDQLKHQLSPRQKKNASPQRSTFQYDFPPPSKKQADISQPNKPLPFPQGSKQNGHQYDMSSRNDEESAPGTFKTQLMEKKQQQWSQENSDKMAYWDPFGRPGAGAPKHHDNQPRTSQPPSHTAAPYRPPPPTYDNGSSGIPSDDLARVPAAMRTNLAFGNGRHQENVETLKEMERRRWVDDLHKQIDENKRKKYAQQESERREDFLRGNVHPLVQEAANRHQPASDSSSTHYPGQDSNKFNPSTQPAYNDVKSKGPPANTRTGENIFGPTYDSPSNENSNNKADSSHLHVNFDRQQPYRPSDARRDEAVNTVDTTFRSDHGIQTDTRLPPNKRIPGHAYDESDLPPQGPHGHRNGPHRNNSQHPGKRTTRVRSLDDDPTSRHATTGNHNGHNADTTSQMNSNRIDHRQSDVRSRPLWNYNQQKRTEYVPNSKRDPHYEKRQRLKQLEMGNYDRVDDVQKKTCYNRWNSDSEIQQRQAHPNQSRSTIPKTATYGNHKDESIMNLLKGQHKQHPQQQQQQQQQQHEAYGNRYPPSNQTRADDDYPPNRPSSLDRYDNYASYLRSDEGIEPAKTYSQPPEISFYPPGLDTNTNVSYPPRQWDNTNRQYPTTQSSQYTAPTTKQEHILHQLSTIKENIIRRQRELASPVTVTPT